MKRKSTRSVSAKKKANENWSRWKLILSDMNLTYTEVFHQMNNDEIEEANAALDIYIKQLNKKK